jgi:hypothetical protein
MIGKRYAEAQRGLEQPFVSVVMVEFSPFAYENFAHILVTMRGANGVFLFALQNAPQLLQVGRGFRNDVASAPNTTFMLRIKDEEIAQDFCVLLCTSRAFAEGSLFLFTRSFLPFLAIPMPFQTISATTANYSRHGSYF